MNSWVNAWWRAEYFLSPQIRLRSLIHSTKPYSSRRNSSSCGRPHPSMNVGRILRTDIQACLHLLGACCSGTYGAGVCFINVRMNTATGRMFLLYTSEILALKRESTGIIGVLAFQSLISCFSLTGARNQEWWNYFWDKTEINGQWAVSWLTLRITFDGIFLSRLTNCMPA